MRCKLEREVGGFEQTNLGKAVLRHPCQLKELIRTSVDCGYQIKNQPTNMGGLLSFKLKELIRTPVDCGYQIKNQPTNIGGLLSVKLFR